MTMTQTKKSIHPLIAIAAGSLIVVSLVGIAAMTGMLPNSNGEPKSDSAKASVTLPENNGAGQSSNKELAKNSTSKNAEKLICQQCGVVTSVRSYEQKAQSGSGVGAVAGAVLGGVIGNQVGGGNGRKIATVAGAVGGGYAGNEIEKSRNTHTVYEVTVKMENGDTRTFKPSNRPDWRSGDRVRLNDGRLVSND